MRMQNLARAGQSEWSEAKKVHPQLSGSKGCGCRIWPEPDRANGLKRKKCIRNCQEARDADAEFGKIQTERMTERKKSASATARKQAMRMQVRTARRNCVAREARGTSKPRNAHREAQANQGTRTARHNQTKEHAPRTEMEEEYERSEKPHDK